MSRLLCFCAYFGKKLYPFSFLLISKYIMRMFIILDYKRQMKTTKKIFHSISKFFHYTLSHNVLKYKKNVLLYFSVRNLADGMRNLVH